MRRLLHLPCRVIFQRHNWSNRIMALAIFDNFRGFVHHRPPLVIFMISLATFAIVLMTLAYIVKVRELPNPDITEDWNTFLQSFSEVEFCVLSNSSDYVTETTASLARSTSLKAIAATDQPTKEHSLTYIPEGYVNVSVSMLVQMRPTPDFVSIPHNVTYVSTTLTGDQLGLSGDASGLEMNATFALPNEWNNTVCTPDGHCDPVNIYTCISFQAPSSFFPTTPRPDTCHSTSDGGVEYHVKMVGFRGMKTRREILWCHSQPVLHVTYRLDSRLTIMLSLQDKSLINLHLMHTSYFLFVMVITLFCYAIIKGRPLKTKIVQHVVEKH